MRIVRTDPRKQKLFAGARVRRLREAAGERQSSLAKALGISPSYLNQIERDQRPLPPGILQRVCAHFAVGIDHFGEDEELRTAQDLREALADPLFDRPVELSELHAAVRAAPELTRRFLLLHRAYLTQADELRGQGTRPSGFVTPYDEVRDWVQSRQNHFKALDAAAETLFETAGFRSAILGQDLTRRLGDAHGFAVSSDPSLLLQGTFWRLDRKAKRLELAESASSESRVFWMAHLLGQLEQRRLIEQEVHAARFSTAQARSLARVSLGNYFAGALMFPYRRFLEAAEETGYDIERLQSRFGGSFEQICHRLSTMQRPGRPGIPFFFAKTDIAGNILKRSSATRFQFSRLGGPCPLWSVYRTFASPGQILIQLARTPDNVAYLNIARTVIRSGGFHLARPRAVAVVLGCEIEHAARTVYATGLDLEDADAAVPIGPGCRACERTACRHRAMPPAGHDLDVGTEERGVVPYRIKNSQTRTAEVPLGSAAPLEERAARG